MPCKVYEQPHGVTREGGRILVSGQCELKYATPKRTLLVRIGDTPAYVFNVRVAARPESRTYSDWFAVDEIQDTGQTRLPRPNETADIHYGAR